MDSFSSSPGSGSSFLSLEDKSASVIWGCELNDRTRKCVVEEDDDLLEHFICLRTVSLGEDAADESHVVAVESKNMAAVLKPVTIASLCHSILPMVSLDGLELIPPVTFFLKSGTGPVYLNGHHLILDEDSSYSEDSDHHDHSSEESEEHHDLDHTSLEDEEELATAEPQTEEASERR